MKITVVGAGNAGCLSALHLGWFTRKFDDVEIELVYNPNIPAEVTNISITVAIVI